jgi:hypothetical protein
VIPGPQRQASFRHQLMCQNRRSGAQRELQCRAIHLRVKLRLSTNHFRRRTCPCPSCRDKKASPKPPRMLGLPSSKQAAQWCLEIKNNADNWPAEARFGRCCTRPPLSRRSSANTAAARAAFCKVVVVPIPCTDVRAIESQARLRRDSAFSRISTRPDNSKIQLTLIDITSAEIR